MTISIVGPKVLLGNGYSLANEKKKKNIDIHYLALRFIIDNTPLRIAFGVYYLALPYRFPQGFLNTMYILIDTNLPSR